MQSEGRAPLYCIWSDIVDSNIIKMTKPFERLNIDFKVPSITKIIYMLTIIDEHSWFPFVYPCPTTDTNTVTTCLSQLFSLFAMPAYVHSDRGPSFMSTELKQWLREKGIYSYLQNNSIQPQS